MRVGLAGERQGIAAVDLRHESPVGAVADPGDLVFHHRPEQPAVGGDFAWPCPDESSMT